MAIAPELGRYLEAIVELTRHRDPQELATALLDTLGAIIDGARIRLLAIANDNRDAEFNESNVDSAIVYDLLNADAEAPHAVKDDPDLLACVRTQAPITAEGPAGHRIIFPVFGANHVWGLFVIEGFQGDPPQELLTKLLKVYSNQSFILSRSQLDPLTGLYNRQSFYERIRRVTHAPQRRSEDGRKHRGHCFALLDVDHFKLVNDRYGHLYGDEVLLLLARLMTRSFRHEDLLFRYGGEEFAVVLINVDLDSAGRLLERFRRSVEEYSFPQIEHKTVSIGYTALTVEMGADKVIMCADKALYYAKNNGRNQVCCYEKLIAEGKLEPVAMAEGDIELF